VEKAARLKNVSGSRGIQSVEIGLKLLHALMQAPGALTLSELSEISDMPASKAHRYLASFQREQLVHQDSETGKYDLGLMALRLGVAALARVDLVTLISNKMQVLADETGVTALLNVWSARGPIIIKITHSRRSFVSSLGLGSVLPVLRSATGRVFLAFLPSSLTSEVVGRELDMLKNQPLPPQECYSKDDIDALISSARANGLAAVDGHVIPGLCAIAAPVLNTQGEAAAVITLIDNNTELPRLDSEVAQKFKAFCEALSV
jgi:DNA-binding IclR family transcriptional regulator